MTLCHAIFIQKWPEVRSQTIHYLTESHQILSKECKYNLLKDGFLRFSKFCDFGPKFSKIGRLL